MCYELRITNDWLIIIRNS